MSRTYSWRAPPDKPAPRDECPWCGESKSRAALENGHRSTRACIALGHQKRARERGLIPIGALAKDDGGWRVACWLPLILRGRAPFEVLPTRAKRKGNQCTPHYDKRGNPLPNWYDAREVWIPAWVNLFLAGSVERDGCDVARLHPAFERTALPLFRWAGKDDANARALAAVYWSPPPGKRGDLARMRGRLLRLFWAANPSKRPADSEEEEKRDSVDLQESEAALL